MLNEIMSQVESRDPMETEFHQVVREFTESIIPVLDRHPEYRQSKILQRLIEPERTILFRIPWMDDDEVIHINRGFRVQFSSVLGPFKGGLRFHPSMSLSTLKSVGFSHVMQNALTGLPLGGGAGGADFDPKGKSDNEVMRFCQRFMTELFRHIGAYTDILTRGLGVGGREIGYLFGQYKTLANKSDGAIVGKGLDYGGSQMYSQATGYGCAYFAQQMLATNGDSLKGKNVLVSGSGNVAIHAMEKAQQLGATCVACSDTNGFVHDPAGLDLDLIRRIKEIERGRIEEYAHERTSATFTPNWREIWTIKCDVAIPCATRNEIDAESAQILANNGCVALCEGASMPTSQDAVRVFLDSGVLFGPAKAANIGGIVISTLEMSQNSMRLPWSIEETDRRLQEVMANIHKTVALAAEQYGAAGNLVHGANIAGFLKLARTMQTQGLV